MTFAGDILEIIIDGPVKITKQTKNVPRLIIKRFCHEKYTGT
jgi:hypothetical protein